MTKNRWMGIAVAFVFVLNIVLLFMLWLSMQGQRTPQLPPRREPGEKMRAILKSDLGLSELQIEQFEKSRKQHQRQSLVFLNDIKNLKGEMFNELFETKPDSVKVTTLIDSIGEKQKQLERLTYEHFAALKDVCGDDQQQQQLRLIIDDFFRPPHEPPPGRPRRSSGRPVR